MRSFDHFSAPGRVEIGGNHTDHQHGTVLAAAIDLATEADVQENGENVIRVVSEGYAPVEISLSDLAARPEERNTTAALVRGVAAGRDTHLLAGSQPVFRFHPLAIDAQLPGAAHLFHRALRQLRKPLLQPAVDALVAIIDADLNCLNAAHAKIPRPKAKPAKTAASENRTEAST